MSLKNALETAREILEQHQTIEETYVEAEEMKKKKAQKPVVMTKMLKSPLMAMVLNLPMV